MNTKRIAGGAFTGLALAGGLAGMVSAQSAATATGLTEEQIIAIALTEVPGEWQEIEKERKRGMVFYEVEILTDDGTEIEVKVAGETGEIINVKEYGEECDHEDENEGDA